MEIKQKNLGKSQMEIEFELTAEEFQKHVEHALLHLKEHVKIDGFRQGNAPLKMVEEKIGKENLLMEAGDHAVNHVYSDYILENNLEPIGQPEVSIIKIAQGSPFIFKAKITVLPEIKLPDYKEIVGKVKAKEVSVLDAEIEDALNYLQKTRAKFSQQDRPAEKKDFVEITYQSKEIDNNKEIKDRFILGEGGFMKGFEDNVLGMKAGDEKDFSVKFPPDASRKDLAGKEVIFKVKMISAQKMELPEINDEFAKQLGVFDTLAALKANVREGITAEKTEAEKQRKRGEILDKIAEKTVFSPYGGFAGGGEIPEKLVEREQERLFEDLKNNINNNLKISFENYLASVKKTEDELKKTFGKEAEKRLKTFLVLREIGKQEKVEVLDLELEEELNKSIKYYSKEQLEKIDIDRLKEYDKGVIFNEKVFQILEKFSQ